jgi:toxin ParE1/3/4
VGERAAIMMELEFRPRALADLEEIRDFFLAQDDDGKADRIRQHLVQRFNALVRKPTLGVKTSRPNIRILSPLKYPYRNYFTVIGQSMVILHIRHTSRGTMDLQDL